MVTNVNYTCGGHITVQTNTESQYCTPETNIMLYVSYISIRKLKISLLSTIFILLLQVRKKCSENLPKMSWPANKAASICNHSSLPPRPCSLEGITLLPRKTLRKQRGWKGKLGPESTDPWVLGERMLCFEMSPSRIITLSGS